MAKLYVQECTKWRMRTPIPLTLCGHSHAGERTGFVVPELGLHLDAGVSSEARAPVVLLTHTHLDHCGALPQCVQVRSNKITSSVYCPNEAVAPLGQLFLAMRQLDECCLAPAHPIDTGFIHGVSGGDVVALSCKGKTLSVRVVQCFHRVPCVGYAVSREVNRLKPEFRGMPGDEIGKLRKEGTAVTTSVKEKLFVFLGDTTADVFEAHPDVLTYPVVIVECTLWEAGMEEKATGKGHLHWSFLRERVRSAPETVFVLIHFSLRQPEHKIAEFFRDECATHGLRNVVLWLDQGVVECAPPQEKDGASTSRSTDP